MWPGKTFLDSWPECLERWPNFHSVTSSHLFSDALFDTWGVIIILDSGGAPLIYVSLWSIYDGRENGSAASNISWEFVTVYCFVLFGLLWRMKWKRLQRDWPRGRKKTQHSSVNVRAACFSIKDDEKMLSERWEWRLWLTCHQTDASQHWCSAFCHNCFLCLWYVIVSQMY